MAILQRTLVTNSIWIGTSTSGATPDWSAYNTSNTNIPFAIYKNNDKLLYYQTGSDYNTLYFNTKSNQGSVEFNSAFPLGYGYKI